MFILGITFKEFIQKGNVIFGLVLAVLGVAFWLLAKNITQSVRKTEQIKSNDTVLIAWKVVGLVGVLVGMVLMALPL